MELTENDFKFERKAEENGQETESKEDVNLFENFNLINFQEITFFSLLLDLYQGLFSKYKFKGSGYLYSMSKNDLLNDLLYDLGSTINLIQKRSQSPYDYIIDLDGNLCNENKKEIFTKLNERGVICTNSKKFQLDIPDVRYLSNKNISLGFFTLDLSSLHREKLTNFLEEVYSLYTQKYDIYAKNVVETVNIKELIDLNHDNNEKKLLEFKDYKENHFYCFK